MGYEALYDIFQQVKKYNPHKPIIIKTEDLYNNPYETVSSFCKRVEIPFKEEAFSWEDLGQDFSGHKEWDESKYPNFTHQWHGEAIRSTHFFKPTQYEVDAEGKPTFSEIKNEEDRAACEQTYQESLIHYNLLLAESDYFLEN